MTKIIKNKNWQTHSDPRCPRRPIAPKQCFEHLQLLCIQDTEVDEESTLSLTNVDIPIGFTYKDVRIKYGWSNDDETSLMKVYLVVQKNDPHFDENGQNTTKN